MTTFVMYVMILTSPFQIQWVKMNNEFKSMEECQFYADMLNDMVKNEAQNHYCLKNVNGILYTK
jgi:hypothetical protein